MKPLFDHRLPPKLIKRLADLYPESNHVYPPGLDKADDESIWVYARQESFLIVTEDADFSDLSLLLGFPLKVIWISRGNCATADIEEILRHVILMTLNARRRRDHGSVDAVLIE